MRSLFFNCLIAHIVYESIHFIIFFMFPIFIMVRCGELEMAVGHPSDVPGGGIARCEGKETKISQWEIKYPNKTNMWA